MLPVTILVHTPVSSRKYSKYSGVAEDNLRHPFSAYNSNERVSPVPELTLLAARVPAAPETPTVAEQGLAGFETGSFQGIVGPAGLPREAVARLNGELIKVLNTPDMKERFAKLGTEVRTGTPESLGQWLRVEQARWAKVVKDSGVKFD